MYTRSSGSPDAILEWLQNEMGYRPLRPYASYSMPTADSLRNICRGNMIPVWSFLLSRVKSHRTVENIRRNILVHGAESDDGRRREEPSNTREMALQERELAEKDVLRLRQIVRRQRKVLKAKMIEVSKEEAERKSMLDERSNYRHKHVMLEAYDQQCNEATKIFAIYHKVLQYYVKQNKDVEKVTGFHANNENDSKSVHDIKALKGNVQGTCESIAKHIYEGSGIHLNPQLEASKLGIDIDGNLPPDIDLKMIADANNENNSKSVHDIKTLEGNVQGACESIAKHISKKIQSSFPAYEGSGIHLNPQLEASKLGIDIDGNLPPDIDLKMIAESLSSPPQLLQAITSYTQKLKTLITGEVEKIDVRDDAEALRYNHDNNTIIEASSPDVSSILQYDLYGNGKLGGGGIGNQLLERQKVHVQQFLATEFALNKAAEARKSIQLDLKNLHGIGNAVTSHSSINDGASENMSSLRLMVWAKEREVAGLKASLKILMSEVHRLNKLCAERKEAENSLRKKWKKIEEFDARRSELETICNALLRANMDAASFWSEQPIVAREYASSTIIPACNVVLDLSNSAKYLIDNEVSAFIRTPDNSLYMLPSTPKALLESMGASSFTGPEAFATAERNAVVLTARAGARDPTAVPSICRISAALQYPAGVDGLDSGLASVLESMEFCLKLRGSEACVLEELAKTINLVHVRRDLVESCHALLNHAHCALQEYDRTTKYCLNVAAKQEKTVTENWLPELSNAVLNANKCLEHCEYIRGLLDEWREQPASTVVDWGALDGENVAAWQNHVKQLLTYLISKGISIEVGEGGIHGERSEEMNFGEEGGGREGGLWEVDNHLLGG